MIESSNVKTILEIYRNNLSAIIALKRLGLP